MRDGRSGGIFILSGNLIYFNFVYKFLVFLCPLKWKSLGGNLGTLLKLAGTQILKSTLLFPFYLFFYCSPFLISFFL